MKKFLVPLDFSAVSEGIGQAGADFAKAFGGKVVLLHVVQPPIITSEYALPIAAVQETIEASEKAAQVRLEAEAKKLGETGATVEVLVGRGPPIDTILTEAGKIGADYIIMGSHGHGKFYDLLVGSTANGVIKGARCGVVILPSAKKA